MANKFDEMVNRVRSLQREIDEMEQSPEVQQYLKTLSELKQAKDAANDHALRYHPKMNHLKGVYISHRDSVNVKELLKRFPDASSLVKRKEYLVIRKIKGGK